MKTGDRVVCVRGDDTINLKTGVIYTVLEIGDMPCCGRRYMRVNSTQYGDFQACGCGAINTNKFGYDYRRFSPFEYNSAHGELIKEIAIEKLDIPIKEPAL